MKILILFLCLFSFSFSDEKIYKLYQDSSWATYTMVHPLKTVNSTSANFFGELKASYVGIFTFMEVNIVADPKTFTCGSPFIDDYAMEIIEYHKHKEIKFKGYVIENQDGTYVVNGTLSFHGEDKNMWIPVTYESNGDFVTAYGEFNIYLDDFKLKRPRVLGMYIDKKLNVKFKLTTKIEE